MANFWKVNQTSTDGAVRVWDLIETMLAAGWTMPNASDGTTMEANRVTGPGSGDYGLGNTRAWVRLQDPGGLTEYTIQRTTTNNNTYRIKRSVAAKFTGGAPDATTTPTATDETIVKGSGTDASPTGVAMFTTTNSRHHCMAENTGYYDFYLINYPAGGGTCNGIFAQDTVESFGGILDTDPVVVIVGSNVNNSTMVGNVLQSSPAVGVYGYLGATFAPMRTSSIIVWNTGGFFTSSQGNNPFTGKDDIVPLFFGRLAADTAPNGMKGASTKIQVSSVIRASGDTFETVTPRDRIVLWDSWTISLPWNGDVPLV